MRLLAALVTVVLFMGCGLGSDSTAEGVAAFEAKEYALAMELLQPSASDGNPEAQFYIAKMYHSGLGVPKNSGLAYLRYSESASQGFAKAQFNLGLMILKGDAPETDPEIGYEWVAMSADQGLALAQNLMGLALVWDGSPIKQDVERGLSYYKAAAQQDHAESVTALGNYYAFKKADYAVANQYFEKAAALGDPEAMHRLSFVYAQGTLRDIDKQRAHSLLKTAADKEYQPAYFDLAMSYIWGNGIEQDLTSGIQWLKLSAEDANDPRAMEALAQILLEKRDNYLTKVRHLDGPDYGVVLREKAAKLGDSVAQLNLFLMNYRGDNVPVDKGKAIRWLEASADNGNPDAQWELGRQYLNGWDVPINPEKALSLYEAAARGGHSKAITAVGAAYAMPSAVGLSIDRDREKAMFWLEKSGESESDVAGIWMAIYLFGDEVTPEDRLQAEKWIRKSEEPALIRVLPALYLYEAYGVPDIDKSISLGLEVEPMLKGDSRILVQQLLAAAYGEQDDLKNMFYWLKKLTDAEDPTSQYAMGMFKLVGVGDVLKDSREGWRLVGTAAENGNVDAQSLLGLAYLVGSDELDFGKDIQVDEKKGEFWLSRAAAQGDGEAEQLLLEWEAEVRAREREVARQNEERRRAELARRAEIERLERQAQLERAEREKRELARQLAEYKRQQNARATQSSRPSFGERLIGGFFEALGEGVGLAISAKVSQELGVRSLHDQRVDEFRGVVQEENERLRRELKQEQRMQQIMKNLKTPAKIGCESYGC